MFNSINPAGEDPLTDSDKQLLRQIAGGTRLISASNVYLLENWPIASAPILALIERGYLTADSPHALTSAGQRALHSK